MVRTFPFLLMAIVPLADMGAAWGAPRPGPPPVTYELMINGESFFVQANHQVKLQSKQKPGVTYDVAIRVAPVQRLTLNTIQLDYDRHTRVEDNRQRQRRTVVLHHELGFTMLITDLGAPLDEQSRDKALELLSQPMLQSLRDRGIKDATVGNLGVHQFEGGEGRGLRIRYRDSQGIAESTLVYIMVGKSFTASCIVQLLDADGDDVLPLIKKTFDSIRAIERSAPPKAKPAPKG